MHSSIYIPEDKAKTLTYINLPLNFQYAVAAKVYVEAGPQLDFLLSGKLDSKYYDPMSDETTTRNDLDIKDDLKSTFSRRVLSKTASRRSQLVIHEPVRTVLVKSTSCRLQPTKLLFFICTP